MLGLAAAPAYYNLRVISPCFSRTRVRRSIILSSSRYFGMSISRSCIARLFKVMAFVGGN